MTMLSKSALIRFSLDNKAVNAYTEWLDTSIESNFENDVQASINIQEVTFVNEEAELVRQWIDQGKTFQGIPFKVDAYNISLTKNAFNGMFDLYGEFT